MRRKFMAWLLTFAMLVTMMPTSVFADTTSGEVTSPYTVTNPAPILAEDNNGLYLSKTLSDLTPAGEGTITLETYVQGSVNTSSVPLDIVLVLDQSGSMEEKITTPATYQQMTGRNSDFWAVKNELYVKNGDQYVKVTVTRAVSPFSGYTYTYTYGSNSVVSAGSRSTPDITLYRYYSGTQSKLSALKSSVTSFTASVAERNEDIENAADKHRIAIVGFASKNNYGYNTEILTIAGNNSGSVGKKYNDLTTDDYKNALVDADATIVTTAIDALDAEGATEADLGMDMAEKILAQNPVPEGSNRKQIVIMFTDGSPTTYDGFEAAVANDTIAEAKAIKENADVYTIGLFNTNYVQSSETNVNKFMNYTSSNYPNASNLSTPGTGKWGGKYYQVAEDAASLDQIFQTISNDVQSIKLDETTIIKDVLSANFDLGTNVDADDIEVFVADYTGNGTFADAKAVDYEVTIDGETVKVKGFDFEPVIDKADGSVTGKKLIIEVPVKIDESKLIDDAGETVGSNNTDVAIASVDNPDGQSWAFPIPQVTLPVYVDVNKVWDDAEDQDGIRPDSVTIKLLANNEDTGKTLTLSDANKWNGRFEKLPKLDADGDEIAYSVAEAVVPTDYTAEVSVSEDGVYTVTNTEVIDIPVTKVWNDDKNRDGLRPETVTVSLMANGTEVDSVTLGEKLFNKWSHTFEDVPKYANGTEIEYTVEEASVPKGYTAEVKNGEKGFTVTNTHELETVNIAGSKTWDDANNQDGKRPASIKVNLLADGEVVETKTVTANDNWAWSFTAPKHAEGKVGKTIEYTVTEEAVEDYTTLVTGFDITNTHEVEKVSVKGSKTWNDDEDRDGLRPESIEVSLLADGEVVDTKKVTEADKWSWSFTDLDKFKAGKEIVYTVTEEAVEGYDSEVNGYNITNTHEIETVDIEGSKTWNDADNQDGIRPDSITVNLLADDEIIDTQTVTKDNWAWSFTELPKYRDGGEEIEYTVEEEAVEGYEADVDGYDITNTHEVEKTSVSGSKTWNDKNNQDGKRPTSVTIKLLANNEVVDTKVVTEDDGWAWSFEDLDKYENGVEIQYTIAEEIADGYVAEIDGYDVTNTYAPEKTAYTVVKAWDDANNQDGIRPEEITVTLYANGKATEKTLTLNEANSWSGAIEDLDKYADGQVIEYSVKEEAVSGYESSTALVGNVFTITNTHKTAEVEVPVTKTWADENDRDGLRPDSITIKLLADGEATEEVVELTSDNKWAGTFKNLPKFKDGVEIAYTVEEEAVTGYTSEMTGLAAEGFKFTNTHEVEKTAVNVAKEWNDGKDQDGLRPEAIKVNLLADGKVVDTETLNADNNWAHKFENLNKNDNGKAIEYTVEEANVPEGYEATVSGTQENGFTITNTHAPAEVAVRGEKVWNDANNQDGIRPATIEVKLLADGEVVDTQIVSGNTWEYVFNNLPKYNKGVEINYTVDEVAVDGYTKDINGTTITNTHKVEKVSVSGTKTWNDANNQDGKRPESITINLLANGQKVDSKTVTAADGWAWSFTNLDKFADGVEIEYTFSEEAVDDYSVKYEGSAVINDYTPEQTFVTVSKTWNDDNNRDGIRPDSVIVELYADGVATGKTLELTKEGQWIGSFTELYKYRDGGVEIVYTVEEVPVDGYEAAITGDATEGYNITNTHEPEKTSVSGSKTWNDANNQDGKRPGAITVNLLANGEEIAQVVVGEEEGWAWSFDDLYVYEKNGQKIEYTITEDEVVDYTTEINGYDITNIHEPETTEFTITKGWLDDKKAERPESITVNILADGEICRTVELTEEGGWELTVSDLPKYVEGQVGVEVVYSVDEVAVDGYTTEIEGFDIFNTKIPPKEKTEPPVDPEPPVTPDDDDDGGESAKTGDNMNIMALAGTALAALAAALTAIFRRKKNA